MLGRELIAQCAEGDRIELASGAGKVHWVWLDRFGTAHLPPLDAGLDQARRVVGVEVFPEFGS